MQNKVITAALEEKADKTAVNDALAEKAGGAGVSFSIVNNKLSALHNGAEINLNADLFDMVDAMTPDVAFPLRRMLWRGKNLGEASAIPASVYEQISAGTFKGLFLGDYFTISGAVHRIVDFNYWLNSFGGQCTTNHLVLMPDRSMYIKRMNATDTTAGGYGGSELRASGLNDAKSTINSAFGSAHILAYKDFIVNAVTNGIPVGSIWVDATIEIASQIMMYGSAFYGYGYCGTNTDLAMHSINKQQLADMQANPVMVNPHSENFWLRDTVSGRSFACLDSAGYASRYVATAFIGVRPVYGIKA